MALAFYECGHNIGAKSILYNRLLGILANSIIVLPASASFKRYHLEHHNSKERIYLMCIYPLIWKDGYSIHHSKKLFGVFFKHTQPAFYALRPLFLSPKDISLWEIINILILILTDVSIVYLFGIQSLLYLAFDALLGMGLHPIAGHFIAEHCVMHLGQETYSYYGPLNWFAFYVGYHNEHYDFPFIPGCQLAQVHCLAPESYDDIPHYHSWGKVVNDYLFDSNLSPYSRMKCVMVEQKDIDELCQRGGLVK